MIASDFNEFIDKASEAIRTALNTDTGQEITTALLNMKLQENPNMTVEEWDEAKSEFMTFIFTMFVQECPEAMQEMAHHVYNELQAV